ncbi:hypothetical protein DPMN_020467 [Dreissena polymorpha]|uniref:Uncharacterized protein n=1 Tax=Dreissena polymorpha TaxID=45954 RepID=A0A9D4NL69_DREPO|nr:hypothetical protein DPMN_020467 [Dreissena polymorpha]
MRAPLGTSSSESSSEDIDAQVDQLSKLFPDSVRVKFENCVRGALMISRGRCILFSPDRRLGQLSYRTRRYGHLKIQEESVVPD